MASIVDVNPALSRMWATPRDEVLGTRAPGDHPRRVARHTARRLRAKALAGEPCHEEIGDVHKSGARIDVEIRAATMQLSRCAARAR